MRLVGVSSVAEIQANGESCRESLMLGDDHLAPFVF